MKTIYTMTRVLLCFPFFLSAFGLGAQDIVSVSDGGIVTGVSCASSVIITDSNADNGNYGPNESFVITICVEEGSETPAEIIISPELFGDVWDVDENSNLFVYDGNNTGAPLLGSFNSVIDPAGITVTGTTGCLTMEFISGATSTGQGFTATFSCIQPLQDFNFDIVTSPALVPYDSLPKAAVLLCFSQSFSVDIVTSYPLSDAGGNGYMQSDSSSYFKYQMGDGTTYEGLGMSEISHAYADPFGYLVTVTVRDTLGKVEFDQFYVLIAPRPDFSNLAVDDTLCIGAQTQITGGIDGSDFIGVDPTSSAILGGGILGEQLFLPDGSNENYETTITIDEFDDGQVITSVTDFVNFCVNMEHSYLGDLEMMLTCPDGTSINIFNSFDGTTAGQLFPGGFGGGGIYLGDANDSGAGGVPGIGFDYCFNDDAEFGTLGEEYDAQNFVTVNTFGGDQNAMAPGTYQPEESFANFIGCPINGNWTLTVRDNLNSDDGFIFNWSIFFDPEINPSTIYYSPAIDSVYWEDNVDIIANNGATITVQPSQEGNNAFTFVAIDEFDCIHDTTVLVYVRPLIDLPNQTACDLTAVLSPIDQLGNGVSGGVYEVTAAPNPGSLATFTQLGGATYTMDAQDYGLYDVLFTEENCGYFDDATIDFRPDPNIAPLVADTTLCVGASIFLDA